MLWLQTQAIGTSSTLANDRAWDKYLAEHGPPPLARLDRIAPATVVDDATELTGCVVPDNDCWTDPPFMLETGLLLAPRTVGLAMRLVIDYRVAQEGGAVLTDLVAVVSRLQGEAWAVRRLLEEASGLPAAQIEAGWHGLLLCP